MDNCSICFFRSMGKEVVVAKQLTYSLLHLGTCKYSLPFCLIRYTMQEYGYNDRYIKVYAFFSQIWTLSKDNDTECPEKHEQTREVLVYKELPFSSIQGTILVSSNIFYKCSYESIVLRMYYFAGRNSTYGRSIWFWVWTDYLQMAYLVTQTERKTENYMGI